MNCIEDLNAKASTFKEQHGDKRAEAPVWVPDDQIKACTVCGTIFCSPMKVYSKTTNFLKFYD